MHLVEIGHGVVSVRDVAELGDRRDVAIHRVDGFKCHQLRRVRVEIAQLAFEVRADRYGRRCASALRLCLMPSIIEAWLSSSDRIVQPGIRDASVLIAAQLET